MTKKPTYEELEQRVGKLEEVLLGREHVGKELLLKENIIMSSSSVIATCDLEGKMTYGNPSFLKTWGFDDPKEFLGRPFWEFWLVKERLDEIMQALRSMGKWLGEIKAKKKDGTLFDVQVSAATVHDVEGNPIALTSTSTDITERKLSEKALHQSEERLSLAAEIANIGMWEWNIKLDRIFPNVEFLKMTGLTEEETHNFSLEFWLSKVHPENRRLTEGKLLSHFRGETERVENELRIKHPKKGGYGSMGSVGLLNAIRTENRYALSVSTRI